MVVRIEGLEEAIKKLSPDLYAEPLRRFWERSAIAVQSKAKTRPRMPVDTGRLTNSIMYEIDTAHPPLYAKVGSDVEYAPYQEFGTSRGLPAREYLQGGMQDAMGQIQGYTDVFAREVAARWSK
jgi:hypothetical protein